MWSRRRTGTPVSKKGGHVVVGLDVKPTSGEIRFPEARRQLVVVCQLRIRFDEIVSNALDVSACIDLAKTCDLF
ncbi:hypothetical protein ACS0Y6_20925, partial [Burkholderia gladioli]|uniref:hypothetical protein n=1 Tax=Burkholderia gladioli TaxID=28095 RepID=UPI003F7AD5D8